MAKPVRVLVVDDSPLFIETITAMLDEDPDLQVVGTAGDGQQAVEQARQLRPDVITIDVHMPVMDGLEAISEIMSVCPTPILVVTGDPRADGGELHFDAIRRGALDVMRKPDVWMGTGAERESLQERVKLLAGVPVVRCRRPTRKSQSISQRIARALSTAVARLSVGSSGAVSGHVVAITASTGGPSALAQILETLPTGCPAGILIVQHLYRGFAGSLASWLDRVTPLEVRVAMDGAPVAPGKVFIAPDDCHMTVNEQRQIALVGGAPTDPHRPSGTMLFTSVARAFGKKAIGMVLTGMGDDGVEGLAAIRGAGGVTLAQDEDSCVVYGMPRVAHETGAAQQMVPLADLGTVLCGLLGIQPRKR